MAPPRKSPATATDNVAVKKQPVRRDMDKRREQNRQSQKTYREKRRKHLEGLERIAAASNPGAEPSSYELFADSTPAEPVDSEIYEPLNTTSAPSQDPNLIDPSLLSLPSTCPADQLISSISSAHRISPVDFLLSFHPDTNIFFDCGCPTLHIPAPTNPFLLPIRPRAFSLHANTLRLDFECTLSALLRNCMHLGIPKSQFCADESESLFYRPLLPSLENSHDVEDETSQLVENTLTLFRTVKHDLRPLSSQITDSHHPYVDVLPFADLRANLVAMQGQMDEDEFLHDFFNQATCWGGAKGSRGGGMPWEGRNWEMSEDFLRKWEVVIGGEEGELTRASWWWKTMRGERVEEVL